MKQGLRRWGAREDLSLLLALIRPSAWKENSPKLDFRLKLSEKGCEQRSERGFGRYRGAETGRTVPLRCPGRPRLTHLRDFSDSFITEFSEVRQAVPDLVHCLIPIPVDFLCILLSRWQPGTRTAPPSGSCARPWRFASKCTRL